MTANNTTVLEAAQHLSQHDQALAPVIAAIGLCTIRPHKNYYQELVQSIIGQQLSLKAAASIEARFLALFPDVDFPAPEQILSRSVEDLRSVGFSRAKAAYVIDLAGHVLDGRIKFNHLDQLSNEEIINELTAVKGIGEWTVHMFMMFCMGRLDVLAHGDLGIKNGIRNVYGLDHVPSAQEIKSLAENNHWHPYETIACWYIWQSLDKKVS